jgi:hypothetical protein
MSRFLTAKSLPCLSTQDQFHLQRQGIMSAQASQCEIPILIEKQNDNVDLNFCDFVNVTTKDAKSAKKYKELYSSFFVV